MSEINFNVDTKLLDELRPIKSCLEWKVCAPLNWQAGGLKIYIFTVHISIFIYDIYVFVYIHTYLYTK